MTHDEELVQKIREKMQIKTIITDDLIDKASKLIGITEDGKIVLKFDKSKLTLKDQILLLLAAYKFAYEAKLRHTPEATLTEISDELAIPEKVASARLSELEKSYLVTKIERGRFSISPIALRDIIYRVTSIVMGTSREKQENE